ncbi:hypothetical protein KVP70_29640 [Duganella sp. HSC-15S17]|uniref:Ferritin-like domain-containing protein n=1 Tax=Duganella violaceipulchra TaxID=2849652 RepID=A0AA41HAN1_9BURK|nr:hypothetical protein [Duganella violaceicalia]
MSMEKEHLSDAACRHYTGTVYSDHATAELLEAVRELVNDDLPHYTRCLTQAVDNVQPVFMRKRYAEFFWHCSTTVRGYLENVIAASSTGEGEGALKLFDLWRSIDYNNDMADQVLRHAQDEARHARMFLRMANAMTPGCIAPAELAVRESTLPPLGVPELSSRASVPEHHLIDHLVQMNIGEIRTRLHMHLFAPIVFNLAPDSGRKLVRGTLEALADDELRHIGYTALLMEQWARDGDADLIAGLYSSRLATFNAITVDHTEGAIRAYGQGRFPDLLEM